MVCFLGGSRSCGGNLTNRRKKKEKNPIIPFVLIESINHAAARACAAAAPWPRLSIAEVPVQICAPPVNDLLVISYLVLERGVWSLPSLPIKHDRRRSDLLRLPLWPFSWTLTPGSFSFWPQREDTQC